MTLNFQTTDALPPFFGTIKPYLVKQFSFRACSLSRDRLLFFNATEAFDLRHAHLFRLSTGAFECEAPSKCLICESSGCAIPCS
eukprot:2619559-Pleurochrysis_carterae.AAC.1